MFRSGFLFLIESQQREDETICGAFLLHTQPSFIGLPEQLVPPGRRHREDTALKSHDVIKLRYQNLYSVIFLFR